MKMIYKYPLADHLTESTIKVSRGAEFLSVIAQFNKAIAYFKVDDSEKELMLVKIFASTTGGFCPPEPYKFMGTVLLNGGNYILHYFYLPPQIINPIN